MSIFEISLLTAAAFCTSALTSVVGAGGGTALIALMLQVMSPAAAIPVHGVVQLASNTTRVFLFWSHMAWPIIARFASLMPFGVALGLWLFQGLPKEVIQILIGCVVLRSPLPRANLRDFAARTFPSGLLYQSGLSPAL